MGVCGLFVTRVCRLSMPIARGLVVGRLVRVWLGSCGVCGSFVGAGGPLGWGGLVVFLFVSGLFLGLFFEERFGLFASSCHPYAILCVSPSRGSGGIV